MLNGFEKLTDLDKYVGKYVDIDYGEGGASGWVIRVDKPYEATVGSGADGPQKEEGRMVHFDYGMGFFVTIEGVSIKEIEPPPGDPGMFKPDNDKPEFPGEG